MIKWRKEPWSVVADCYIGVGAAVAGVAGAGAQALGASNAASAQTKAADQNNARLTEQYNRSREDLTPYRDIGETAKRILQPKLDWLSTPIVMDQNALEQTPGYQFTRTQGLKAVQNSAAARGLGASGAAQKGAADFATGLANNTYKDQFNIAQTNQTNAYNRLKGLVDLGGNAAAMTGSQGNTLTGQQVANTTGGANAAAAGYNALGQAGAGAARGIGTAIGQYNGMYGGGGGGGYGYDIPQYDPYGTGTVY